MVVRRQTFRDKVWPKDWCEHPTDVPAEGRAEGARAFEGDPVALSRERAASDAVYKVFEAWIGSDGFRWGCLQNELACLDE